jgi:RNA polymerase sigma-70 factor, ECF subfamily
MEAALLDTARAGDEAAFARLIEPYRGQLHAHCYRMLGSVHDAEDALQEVSIRAWRGLSRFEGRSSLKSWLYTIATNTCLNAIERRPKRVLPVDYTGAADPHGGPGQPVVESVWIEPYPDELIGVEDELAGPEARYERAVLILREVLGFSAQETADALETSVASVNSALQRARKTIEERTPDQSQQATLRELGDERVREIVERYMEAWERNDVDTVMQILAEDATFAMPPLASWFGGEESIRIFLSKWPMSGTWRWRQLVTQANGQPALAFYIWDEGERAYMPFALNVLTFRGDRVSAVDAFVTRATDIPDGESYARWPDEAIDPARLYATFETFGLPERLTDESAASNGSI